jgi:pimeloyl-ACP methyl ester carboxylesterase
MIMRHRTTATAGVVAAATLIVVGAPMVQANIDTAPKAAPGIPAKYAGQKLAWGKCSFDAAGTTVQCAMMTVPRDWANPDSGPHLQVYVSKVAATGDHPGILLTNPGGPGGKGTPWAASIAKLEPSLNEKFDILGMDPRGTGQDGAPGDAGLGMTCNVPNARLPKGLLDARDRSRKSITDHQQVARAIAEACQSNAVTPYITTWQTAHDMDLLRQLLRAPELNYLGYSYGTWLGAKYAGLFPDSAGRIVLDSSVDWQGRLQADFEDFPRIGQRQTDEVFLPWLNRQLPDLFGHTTTQARRAIERGRTKAIASGISGDLFDGLFAGNGSRIGWFLRLVVLVPLLSDDSASTAALPKAFRAELDEVSTTAFGVPAAQVTPKLLLSRNLGLPESATDYTKQPLTRYAVACGDQPTKTTAWYKTLSDRQGPKYPYDGWQYGLGEICGPWTDAPQHQLPNLPMSVRSNVLVVQGEFDPQTAYEQSMAAVRKAPGVKVLRVDDSPFHGQYAVQANPCVDGIVNSFFEFGVSPDNAICASVPLNGESKVYPVKGPVDRYLTNHHLTKDAPILIKPTNDRLRQTVADQLSRMNLPVGV